MARLYRDSGMLTRTSSRAFGASNAYSVKSKFEQAYNAKMEDMHKIPPK